MPTRPKYQVFISSTYSDLRLEREAVTWYLLAAKHIPAGMESFSAADDRGWKTIRSVIDDSDYYILLLAGRYGSVDASGLGWTEREYRYALRKRIPVLAFIREDTATSTDKAESDPESIKKLVAFKKRVLDTHLCVRWTSKEDLVGKVGNALNIQIHTDQDGESPRPGWYRGDALPVELLTSQLGVSKIELSHLGVLRSLGVERISLRGTQDTLDLRSRICNAQSVKLMFASGATFLAAHHEDLRECIEGGGDLHVLLAEPDSPFLEDVEILEGRALDFKIGPEVKQSIARLTRIANEIVGRAGRRSRRQAIAWGYFRTHLRMSLVIVDDRYCYAILNYSPKRTSESLAFLFDAGSEVLKGPVHHIIEHMNAVLSYLDREGRINRIAI